MWFHTTRPKEVFVRCVATRLMGSRHDLNDRTPKMRHRQIVRRLALPVVNSQGLLVA
jgi:hypothetical protein